MRGPLRSFAVCAVLFLLASASLVRGQGSKAASYSVRIEFDQRVGMRDGVDLSTDIYRPDTAGRFPVILVRTPYDNGVASNIEEGRYWASHGYVYVVQDVRGRGDSSGEFYPIVHEAEDGYDTQAWAASQPWSSGKVGTTGGSYLGWAQVFPAGLQHPGLAAMVLIVTPPDPVRNWPYRFGTISVLNVSWLVLVSGQTLQDLSQFDLEASLRVRPLRDVDLFFGRQIRAWRDWLDHPTLDSYWKQQLYQEKLLQMNVPALHISGWYDDVLVGTLENYVNLATRATDPHVRRHQRLLLGP